MVVGGFEGVAVVGSAEGVREGFFEGIVEG